VKLKTGRAPRAAREGFPETDRGRRRTGRRQPELDAVLRGRFLRGAQGALVRGDAVVREQVHRERPRRRCPDARISSRSFAGATYAPACEPSLLPRSPPHRGQSSTAACHRREHQRMLHAHPPGETSGPHAKG